MSVVTIKGEECRVMELGQVADATGGDVSFIHTLVAGIYYMCATSFICPGDKS